MMKWMETGRTAVITGAAGGIGLEAARRFAAAGMNLVIADEKRIQWTADNIIRNRSALSRWHREFAEAFKTFIGN